MFVLIKNQNDPAQNNQTLCSFTFTSLTHRTYRIIASRYAVVHYVLPESKTFIHFASHYFGVLFAFAHFSLRKIRLVVPVIIKT